MLRPVEIRPSILPMPAILPQQRMARPLYAGFEENRLDRRSHKTIQARPRWCLLHWWKQTSGHVILDNQRSQSLKEVAAAHFPVHIFTTPSSPVLRSSKQEHLTKHDGKRKAGERGTFCDWSALPENTRCTIRHTEQWEVGPFATGPPPKMRKDV